MVAPISIKVAQKIFKALEEQSDILKKMGRINESTSSKASLIQVFRVNDTDI